MVMVPRLLPARELAARSLPRKREVSSHLLTLFLITFWSCPVSGKKRAQGHPEAWSLVCMAAPTCYGTGAPLSVGGCPQRTRSQGRLLVESAARHAACLVLEPRICGWGVPEGKAFPQIHGGYLMGVSCRGLLGATPLPQSARGILSPGGPVLGGTNPRVFLPPLTRACFWSEVRVVPQWIGAQGFGFCAGSFSLGVFCLAMCLA